MWYGYDHVVQMGSISSHVDGTDFITSDVTKGEGKKRRYRFNNTRNTTQRAPSHVETRRRKKKVSLKWEKQKSLASHVEQTGFITRGQKKKSCAMDFHHLWRNIQKIKKQMC